MAKLINYWYTVVTMMILPFTIYSSTAGYKLKTIPLEQSFDKHVDVAPQFDDLSLREIQARVGQTVLLPCTVRHLGDKVVSWIRTKDLHILTSGPHTFSADNRFESVNSIRTHFWGMRIRGVKMIDSGRYECQVNTDPKMSLGINLIVSDLRSNNAVQPIYKWVNEAKIKGPSEVYVRVGSPAIFTCEIALPSFSAIASKSNNVKSHIYWLHDGKEISLDSGRSGISVETDYRDLNSVSRLRVAEVSLQDSGLYTCTQASAKPGSVKLFIVEAEHTEAMQRDAPHSQTETVHNINNYFVIYFTIFMFCVIN